VKLALGTAQFGLEYGISNRQGQVSVDAAKAILDLAAAHGVDTLDTAIAYGNCEQRLGEIGVQQWRVVSKLPAVPDGCKDMDQWVADSVDASLHRLDTKRLYGLLLHSPQQLVMHGDDFLYQALQRLKHEGLVEKVGVSIYDPSELDELFDHYQLDLVQAPFNILDRRLIDSGWLARLSEQGTECHVRSIFLQGLLLMNAGERPEKFRRWQTIWECWDKWLCETGLTPLQACLRYILMFPQIDKAVVGVDSMRQLTEIFQSMHGPLPDFPNELKSCDRDLVNPARWNTLT
jgi:aryl-alcohol dehydrogenase-like predicted oxidoreductase